MSLRTSILTIAFVVSGCAVVAPDASHSSATDEPDFHAIGQEPGWLLDIHDGGQTVFEYDYGQKRFAVSTPEAVKTNGSTVYRSESEGQVFQVIITPTRCTDVMSGKRFGFSVAVILNEQRFEGCGRDGPDSQSGKGS